MDSATITGVIDRLERDGLLRRFPDATDRRVVRLRLTETGRALRADVERTIAGLNTDIVATLSDPEAALPRDQLRSIAKGDR
jgi:DNA-binding MarR family transcriptional regulator